MEYTSFKDEFSCDKLQLIMPSGEDKFQLLVREYELLRDVLGRMFGPKPRSSAEEWVFVGVKNGDRRSFFAFNIWWKKELSLEDRNPIISGGRGGPLGWLLGSRYSKRELFRAAAV